MTATATAYTNDELARVLGLSPSSASRMRSGLRIGSAETLSRLAKAANVEFNAVFEAAKDARAYARSDGKQGDLSKWSKYLADAVISNRPETDSTDV